MALWGPALPHSRSPCQEPLGARAFSRDIVMEQEPSLLPVEGFALVLSQPVCNSSPHPPLSLDVSIYGMLDAGCRPHQDCGDGAAARPDCPHSPRCPLATSPHRDTVCSHHKDIGSTRLCAAPGPRSSEVQEWCLDNQYQQRQGLQILYHSCKGEMMKNNPSLPSVQAAGEACPFLSVS